MPKKRILLVDDNDIDRELIRLKLSRATSEYELLESDSAEEALRFLENNEIDCILSDFQMPIMDGLQFLSTLRRKNNNIPFIFLTGQGSEEVAAEALREGAEDYFTKEESFAHYQRLINSIARVIENHRTLRQKHAMEDERHKRAAEMQALFNLSENIRAKLTYERVIESAMDSITAAVDPDLVILFSRTGNKIELVKIGPEDSEHTHSSTPEHRVGECLCGLAVQMGTPIYSRDIHSDGRCTWWECKKAGIRSFAAIPLFKDADPIGVIGLASTRERDFQEQAPFLETITAIFSSAAMNALKYHDVKQYSKELEASIVQLVEAFGIRRTVDNETLSEITTLIENHHDQNMKEQRLILRRI